LKEKRKGRDYVEAGRKKKKKGVEGRLKRTMSAGIRAKISERQKKANSGR